MNIEEKYPMVGLVTYLIDRFDATQANHSLQVAELSVQTGRRCGLFKSTEELEILELSALLHDIGKMELPESIRTKAGRLTRAEYLLVKQHPLFGFEILSHVNGAIDRRIKERVKKAVLHHHENYDGTGYPNRLKGVDIPLESRIIRITDSYNAMTHSRGYRPAATQQAAIADLQSKITFYDPALLECFIGMVSEV